MYSSNAAEVYYVELETDLNTRLERNETPNRLEHKPTKRDVEWTKKNILDTAQKYGLNSSPGEITDRFNFKDKTKKMK